MKGEYIVVLWIRDISLMNLWLVVSRVGSEAYRRNVVMRSCNFARSRKIPQFACLPRVSRSAFELCGCEVTFKGNYPGWTPNVKSEILDVLTAIYEKQNGEKAKVVACHAGLECGILGVNYPDMDMISFGPTIHGAHSPDERASIKSSQKFYKFVLEILENIPVKS